MAIDDAVKYRTLIETAPDPIFLIDMTSGRIVEVNDRASELLGYDEADLVDRPVESIHPDGESEKYARKFRETVATESIQFSKLDDGTQVYLVASDGERIPVDICANVVEGETGPILLSIARDVTDLRAYEREVEQLAGELAVVNRLVRHDIRNDMSVIVGWLERARAQVDDAVRETIDRALRRSQSVVELTDTVKDYVEMLEDDAEIELDAVPLDEIVNEEVTAIEGSYDEVEVTVEELPSRSVLANSMLASVFRNLFHNAVQHNDKDDPEIRVTAEDRGDSVVVHVADNGPGIPDDRKSEIFGKGDKGLDSSGTGIGLFLIGELVEKFDGDVRVRDNDPEGSVFSVELRTVP